MIGTQSKTNAKFISTVNNIIKTDGVFALWNGSIPTFFRVLPGGFLYFGGMHALKTLFPTIKGYETWENTKNFMIGASARTLAGVVTCPILVVKTRFEFATKDELLRTKSMIGTLRHIYKMEGVYGLFKGLTPTIVRDVPYAGLFLMFYSKFKPVMGNIFEGKSNHDAIITFPSAALASCMATAATHPFDVVRTRLQLNPSKSGVTKTFIDIFMKEGTKSLFRGITLRVAKRSASSALSWSLYEYFAYIFTTIGLQT